MNDTRILISLVEQEVRMGSRGLCVLHPFMVPCFSKTEHAQSTMDSPSRVFVDSTSCESPRPPHC